MATGNVDEVIEINLSGLSNQSSAVNAIPARRLWNPGRAIDLKGGR